MKYPKTTKKSRQKKLTKKLLHKYRLVVLNEDTFEERFAMKLTRLNVFIYGSLFALLLIGFTTVFIAFTPIREYIPGYTSPTLQKQAIALEQKTDSLMRVTKMNERFIASIKDVLSGQTSSETINKDSIYAAVASEVDPQNLNPSQADSILRNKVENEDKYNLFESAKSLKNFVFFPPVKGTVSSEFNLEEQHYAVDIAVPKNTPVKAAADGRVIFASWTSDSGFVLIIDHDNQLITVYKHNASLIKAQGELVKAREVIAISGSSGELSTGPHLHFELWSDGNPIDPLSFIDFQL
ncbi:MAG: M23 family metallopeptidase [Bacteroidetes bacterium]|nr:M23 family metallopeptidase [Bacteroidota bacterium]MDA1175643.1 M23 family metallopeptidase [Bacteroidota bacterium]